MLTRKSPQASTPKLNLHRLPDGEAGTRHTLALMQGLVRASRTSPLVQQVARRLALGARDPFERAERIEQFLRQTFRFVRDPVAMELLHEPEVQLRQWEYRGAIWGDCDDAAVLAAALGQAMGLQARFRVLGWSLNGPFGHVYTVLRVGPQAWYALDVTRLPTVPAPRPQRVIEVEAS